MIKKKRCARCEESKALDEFGVDNSKTAGVSRYCRGCMSDYHYGDGIKTSAIGSSRARYSDRVPVAASVGSSILGDLIGGKQALRTGSVLKHSHTPAPISKVELDNPIDCPCCRQAVRAPTVEMIVDRYSLTPIEARVLGAIWRGKGMPVITERIFTAMYIDDPDGGPSQSKMYLAFKVALCHLRKKIRGSGIDVINQGYRRGYRLIVGEN